MLKKDLYFTIKEVCQIVVETLKQYFVYRFVNHN